MEEFINKLLGQIRCEKAKTGIAREIADHLEDAAEALEEGGMSKEQAMEEAVRSMGDPIAIGAELDRIHRPRMDWRFLLGLILMNLGGLAANWSVYGITAQPCIYMIVGVLVAVGVGFLDYSFLGKYAGECYGTLTVLLIIAKDYLPQINGQISALSILSMLYIPVYAGILFKCRNEHWLRGLAAAVVYMLLPLYFSTKGSIVFTMCLWLVFWGMILAAFRKGWFGSRRKAGCVAGILAGFAVPA